MPLRSQVTTPSPIRASRTRADFCPQRYRWPLASRHVCPLSGASMPNSRMRSPRISSVSPSITEARPAISPEAAQVGELAVSASTSVTACDQELRNEWPEAREVIVTGLRAGSGLASGCDWSADGLPFPESWRLLHVRTIRTTQRQNLHALPGRDPAAHPRGGRGPPPPDTRLGCAR